MTFQSIRCTFRLQVLMLCSCRSAFVVYRLDVVIIGLIYSYVKYYLALFLNYFLGLKSRLTLIQADTNLALLCNKSGAVRLNLIS